MLINIIFRLFLLLIPINSYSEAIIFGANESPPFWSQAMYRQGMCGEIVHAMSEQAGIESKIIFKPLKRLIEDTHNHDLGNPDFYLQQQDYASIIPILSYQASFVYYLLNHPDQIEAERILQKLRPTRHPQKLSVKQAPAAKLE